MREPWPVAELEDGETKPTHLRRQILVVDDVPANLLAVEVALAPLGRQLITACSGTEALQTLLDTEVSLVLLDVAMPELDGFETAALIRAREKTRHLPIIFLTAHHYEPDAIKRAYKLGAVDFLFKPIDADVLRAKAEVFIHLQDRTEELAHARFQREYETRRKEYEASALRREMDREHALNERLADANARLETVNAELEEADRRKDAFIAILAHELRNPLAPIRTCAELLAHAPNKPPTTRTIDILNRQTAMMTRLVDDMLDVSRIRASKLELRPEQIDLRDIVDTAVTTSRPLIDSKKHELKLHISSQPVPITADSLRLVQVIVNVINNAARYTPAGGQIDVACWKDRDQAYVRVTDNGKGVGEDLLKSIFEMFVQERVRSDGSGGLGLGLALAKKLIEMHGGEIRASSPGKGQGSTFEIQIPLRDAYGALVPRTRTEEQAPLAKPEPAPTLRTLVIDDNDDARELIADILARCGHQVSTAADGLTGMELLATTRPDVALVDLGLPGIDGVTLVQRIREQHPDIATRIIALSGYGQEDDVVRTRQAGFDAHLVKPASIDAILKSLRG